MSLVQEGGTAEQGASGERTISTLGLLLIVPSYYPDVRGGAERQATIVAEAFQKLGVAVTLIAPTLDSANKGWSEQAFGRIFRIPLRALPSRGGRYLLSTLSWCFALTKWMRRHRRGFDLAYVFHGRLHVLGPLLGAAAAGRPIVVKLGGGGVGSDFNALRAKRYLYGEAVLWLLLRWTRSFVAVSQTIVEDLVAEAIKPDRIIALSNGAVTPTKTELANALVTRRGTRLIFPSRLVGDKGIEILIEALSLVDRACELTLLGDGPDENRLRRLAQSLGVGERVHFVGAVDDVFPILSVHDIFLSASEREGQSNSLLEAISWGLVPVVAPASGVRDLVQSGLNGFVVETVSPQAFAQAIGEALSLSEQERERWAWSLHKQARETFDIDLIAAKLLGQLEAIAGIS